MWRPWDTDSQEEQQWDNKNDTSEGIRVLASDSDDSVIFVGKKPLPSYSIPMFLPGLLPMPCLPFQVQLVILLHPLVSTDWLFYSNLINMFHLKLCQYAACIRS